MIKIKSIKFYDHYIFGNRIFDFTFNENNIANTIIFAGENGNGKTKLLEELNELCNTNFLTSTCIQHKKICELNIIFLNEKYHKANDRNIIINKAILTRSENNDGIIGNTVSFFSDDEKISEVKYDDHNETILMFKLNGLFSTVDVNYIPLNEVRGITNKILDNDNFNIPRDLAGEIIQLFVDIANQDSNDLDKKYSETKDTLELEKIFHKRINRFTNAFSKVFGDELKYKGIKNNLIPLFEKNNKEVEIHSLSSGEKQIIFRGIYLLKNKNNMANVPIFIDEPEISMHPKWEEKIYDYYKNLFVKDDRQVCQLFFATHSEHVLENALNDDNCLIIKFDDEMQKYSKNLPGIILPIITLSEIKYSIFDIPSVDFHSLLYGYISVNVLNDSNVKQTDEWLKAQGVTLKLYSYQSRTYETLQSYIRNCIDHPGNVYSYSKEELKKSIEEMINIIINNNSI